MENVQQNHRIRAAGDSDEDFLPARQQPAGLDSGFGALKEFTHAASLHFFEAMGKQPARSRPIPNHCASFSR